MWEDVDDSDKDNIVRLFFLEGGRGFNYNILQIAKGSFRHPAILNTFAYYLEAIDGLPHKHLTKDKPCGALALSTVAVSPFRSAHMFMLT